MSAPLLSALIPNYNHARYLGECLDALLSQSRPPDEIIVVDDASTDDSFEVISGFARREKRIQAFRNERNLGTIGTLNRALSLARGVYCYGGATDDYVLPGMFENSLGLLERHPRAGL